MSPPPDDASSVTATKIGGSRAPGGPAFPPDAVLAGRYRIVRFIAKGGMGEVYEAEDLKLGGRLALKTIRAEIAAEGKGVERFLREIKLARTITHPNVSRIFDLDEHDIPPPEGSSEPPQQVLFLTMELLSGDTLAERITRGRMSTTEAFDIVAQIAAGLDAAHGAGVIHRDFKSANVMLEPAADASKRPRAVITDFGLARDADPDAALASISETGIVVGTPAYMAPEQVEGKPLTSAADLYAFGIVMYEMVTGTRPFTGGSPMTVAVKRLQESAPPPRKHIADLDPAWNTAILRCLERDPADRFATAGDIVRALGGERVASGTGVIRRRKRLGLKVAAAVAGVGLVVLSLGVWFVQFPSTGSSGVTAPAVATTPMVPRKAVAVLAPRNVSGQTDVAWLGTAVSEMVSSDLAVGDALRVLPGDAVSETRSDLAMKPDSGEPSGDALARLATTLGADHLVTGSYTAVGGKDSRLLRLELRLHDGKTGSISTRGTATGTEAQLFDIVSRASQPLRSALGLPSVSPAQELQVAAALPTNREAARLYAEALTRLRSSDAQGARDLLEKAVAAEPKHPLPHAALASAWLSLGYEVKAAEEAKKAAALAEALPPSAKREIEATYYQTAKDWPKAIEIATGLFHDAPDSLEAGLRLALVQTTADKAREALTTLESLRKLPAPSSDDPRIDLAEARAYQFLGDSKQQQAAAERAATKGAERGMRSLVARARLLESVARYEQGDNTGSRSAAETARGLAEATGDRNVGARSVEQLARVLARTGDFDGARRLLDSALRVHRELGDLGSVARVLQNTGDTAFNQGKLSEAQRFYDASLAVCDQLGAKYQAATTLNNVGAKLQHIGDLAGAQKRYQEALALFGQIGEKASIPTILTNLAEVMYTRGELGQAEETHKESLAINRELGDKAGEGYDLYRLGLVFTARGDLRAARGRFDESLELLKQVGDKVTAAEARVGLSAVALAEGKAAEAEALARESEEILRTEGATDPATLAQVAVVQALLSQKKWEDARAAVAKVKASADTSEDKAVRFASAILLARVQATSGKPSDVSAALASLDGTAATAAKSGFLGTSFDARLAAGRVAADAAHSTTRSRVAGLTTDARAKGYELIAREASALLGSR